MADVDNSAIFRSILKKPHHYIGRPRKYKGKSFQLIWKGISGFTEISLVIQNGGSRQQRHLSSKSKKEPQQWVRRPLKYKGTNLQLIYDGNSAFQRFSLSIQNGGREQRHLSSKFCKSVTNRLGIPENIKVAMFS